MNKAILVSLFVFFAIVFSVKDSKIRMEKYCQETCKKFESKVDFQTKTNKCMCKDSAGSFDPSKGAPPL